MTSKSKWRKKYGENMAIDFTISQTKQLALVFLPVKPVFELLKTTWGYVLTRSQVKIVLACS